MAVIVTDMDMPKNCFDCDLNNYHVCFATGDTIEDYLNEDEREPHCPLKSADDVASVIHAKWEEKVKGCCYTCSNCLQDLQVNYRFCPCCGAKIDKGE